MSDHKPLSDLTTHVYYIHLPSHPRSLGATETALPYTVLDRLGGFDVECIAQGLGFLLLTIVLD